MKIKVLSVNRYFRKSEITTSSLQDSPSISDYDALIIDPKTILPSIYQKPTQRMSDGSFFTDMQRDGGHGKRIIALFEQRKKETADLIAVNQGLVICYARRMEEPITIKTFTGLTYIANYSWLPTFHTAGSRTFSLYHHIKFRESVGSEVSIVDPRHPFSQFFHAFKNEISFESTIEIDDELRPFAKVIAQNKVKEAISCEISLGGGKMVFLPAPISTDTDKEIGVLLDCIGKMVGRSYATPPPPWTNEYALPGETMHEETIAKLREEISQLEIKKREMEVEQENISRFKGLLYEKGKIVLERLVREAFKVLGFDVLGHDTYSEEYDLYIRERELAIVGEVEGTDNTSIDLDKIRQLLDYVDQEHKKGVETKGILIGNSQRGIPPSERKAQFTNAAIKRAEKLGYCLLTTYQLFEIVKKVLSGISQDELSKIRKSILSCEGEYRSNY